MDQNTHGGDHRAKEVGNALCMDGEEPSFVCSLLILGVNECAGPLKICLFLWGNIFSHYFSNLQSTFCLSAFAI